MNTKHCQLFRCLHMKETLWWKEASLYPTCLRGPLGWRRWQHHTGLPGSGASPLTLAVHSHDLSSPVVKTGQRSFLQSVTKPVTVRRKTSVAKILTVVCPFISVFTIQYPKESILLTLWYLCISLSVWVWTQWQCFKLSQDNPGCWSDLYSGKITWLLPIFQI